MLMMKFLLPLSTMKIGKKESKHGSSFKPAIQRK